ncbi:PLP-dependent aminotransferase family protein [Streptomyces xiamenensis]|uniref:MocR-like pyridoxine biosynthesis transcription factor PdxR n=1 Tax=Streptomyces TaxID=1883 RepID=UPI0019034CEE|nr:PLP-dependent aminotransferase family protein [Streptomyces sp. XC 2026]QQN77465.1 PLP-dependent aminotransferase family protein [Streptomyces sp. XC 2026]
MDRANEGPVGRAKTGSDFLQLRIEEAPPRGRADWLSREIRAAIADGRLPLGSKLPASRVLAAELRVSRGVVTEAYQCLTEDGHVAGRGRAGTVVVAAPVPVPEPGAARDPARPCGALPEGALFGAAPGTDVFDSLRAVEAPYDFTPGVPDLAAFPRAAWLRAERAVLAGLCASDLGYGDPRGAPALRAAVAHWLARNRGIAADPADILIVAGVSQALILLAHVLRARGIGELAVEEPGSLGARHHLRYGGMAMPAVPVDGEGVRVDALRASGARAVLLTPAHQFPTGVVLSGERRRELMAWARESGGLIVEDDYDAEHRYDRPPVPAVRAMLPEAVAYTGSVSKLLAPALRIGWLLPPPAYREALVAAKRFTDLGNGVLAQLVLARLMESGELERQLRMLRRRHQRRRDTMIEGIGRHLPGAVVHGAAAGVHLMITFPPDAPLVRGRCDLELASLALAHGVKVQPLAWHRRHAGPPGLVLGYAASGQDRIAEGMAALGRALRAR